MKDSHWPVFTNVKTNSRRVKFLTFRSFGNLLTSFYIGIAVSGLMLRIKAKEFSKDPEFKASLGSYQKWKRRHSVSLRTKTFVVQLDFVIETQGTAQIFAYAWMEAELFQALSHSVAVEMIAITPISSSALGFIFFLFMLNFRILLCAVLFSVFQLQFLESLKCFLFSLFVQ